MKQITLIVLFFISVLLENASAQRKVKTKIEYNVVVNPKNLKDGKFEKYKIYHFDKTGFLKKLVTYGKKKLSSDTLMSLKDDGSREIKIISNWTENMKKIGRVENFALREDKTIDGSGYEIWNNNDTFRFENTYTLESPAVYAVISKSDIPHAPALYFCDDGFSVLYNEVTSKKEYNDFGQITSKHYLADDEQGVIQIGTKTFFKYNSNGTLHQDSTTNKEKIVSNNRYFYDHLKRIIRSEHFLIRFGKDENESIQYIYNKEGNLEKKYQEKKWATVYEYFYY